MKKANKRMAVEVGAGVLTAAALAVAGAYLLSGKIGKVRRAKIKAWAQKARKEVAQNVKRASRMGEAEYKRLVDRATKRYGSMHEISAKEIGNVARDLKTEWARIKKDARVIAKMAGAKKSKRSAPRRKNK